MVETPKDPPKKPLLRSWNTMKNAMTVSTNGIKGTSIHDRE
jgi:hypothetical protein